MPHRNRYREYTFLFLFLFIQGCSEAREPYYFLEIDLAEQSQERIMVEPYSEMVFIESDFLYPLILEATEKGLFVLDVSDSSRVRKYNWEFELVTRIGRGTGDGPGEIGGVNDIHISGDTLYFTDAFNALLHLYTIDNEFVRSISIENEIADQITTFRDTLVVRTTHTNERPLFIDAEGNPIRRAKSISIDERRYWLILESRLFADEEHLYRFPVYFGFIVKYDKTGSLISARHLVDSYTSVFDDRTRNPLEQPVGIQRDDAVKVSVSAALYQDKICVFRLYRFEDQRFIDCYDKSDLDYRFSFIPPDGTVDFKIYGDYFAAIHDSSLSVWKWDK